VEGETNFGRAQMIRFGPTGYWVTGITHMDTITMHGIILKGE